MQDVQYFTAVQLTHLPVLGSAVCRTFLVSINLVGLIIIRSMIKLTDCTWSRLSFNPFNIVTKIFFHETFPQVSSLYYVIDLND